jgi:hypothetical protein
MIGIFKKKLRGQLTLTVPAETTLAVAGTYYKIDGIFTDGAACGFKVEENKLIYQGPSGVCFLMNGVSDISVNKACELSYALFLNGEIYTDPNGGTAETPHTFPASARTQTMAITALMELNNGDEIEIYAKSSEALTIMTARTLRVTFFS